MIGGHGPKRSQISFLNFLDMEAVKLSEIDYLSDNAIALALTLSANTAFATTNTTTNTNVSDQNTGQNVDKNTVNSSVQAVGAPTATKQAAAGSTVSTKTVTTTQKSFTSSQINSAATTVKNFVEKKNKRLPSYVTISSMQVTMRQFLQLLTTNLLNINSGIQTSVTLKTVTGPSTTADTVSGKNFYRSHYVLLAKNIKSTITSTGKAPGYISTSGEKSGTNQ